MKRTMIQHRALHKALTEAGLMVQKPTLVASFTGSRTTHSSEMEYRECEDLIQYVLERTPGGINDACDRMRKKILSICHQLNWYKCNEAGKIEIIKHGCPQLDYARINAFCIKSGAYHKELSKHNKEELQTLVTQFVRVLDSHLSKKQSA